MPALATNAGSVTFKKLKECGCHQMEDLVALLAGVSPAFLHNPRDFTSYDHPRPQKTKAHPDQCTTPAPPMLDRSPDIL
eukprot:247570-Rhodomonas_salina.2